MFDLPSPVERTKDRRQHKRWPVTWSARLKLGTEVLQCELVNISAGGAQLQLVQAPQPMPFGTLIINGIGEFMIEVVWQHEFSLGVRFLDDPRDVAHTMLAHDG